MEEKVKSLMATVFADDLSACPIEDCIPEKIAGWSSLKFLNLVLVLEEEFGISFEPEEMEEMVAGGPAIVRVLRSKGVS